MTATDLSTYLGKARFDSLNAPQSTIEAVLKRAPNLPTAAIWLLQKCQLKPSAQDLKRWSDDVAKLGTAPAQPKAPKAPKK